MPKNRLDDMVKIKIVKKNMAPSIESGMSRRTERQMEREVNEEVSEKMAKFIERERPLLRERREHRPRYLLWFVAVVSLVFLFFSVSYMFSSATVNIGPKVTAVVLNENISATKDTGEVPFDLVVISGEENKNIDTDLQKHLEVKAKGTVVIFNSFSTKTQTLNIETQLEGSNGRLYKTDNRVVVPGVGKDGKPGKIEVGIHAATPGEEYNSDPLDFKILGFKGTPKYAKIVAHSKPDTKITGGVKGDFYTISDSDKTNAVASLKNSLKSKLITKATEQIPSGFILFPDAVFLNTSDAEVTAFSKDKAVPISLKGTLYGFLFNEKKLTMKIAKDVLDKYDNADIYIPNMKDLSFAITNKDSASFGDAKNISISLKGPSKIVWRFDSDKFASDLLGRDKNQFNSVLSKYPNVSSANLVLKPFWRMSFPIKKQDIKVNVNYPN